MGISCLAGSVCTCSMMRPCSASTWACPNWASRTAVSRLTSAAAAPLRSPSDRACRRAFSALLTTAGSPEACTWRLYILRMHSPSCFPEAAPPICGPCPSTPPGPQLGTCDEACCLLQSQGLTHHRLSIKRQPHIAYHWVRNQAGRGHLKYDSRDCISQHVTHGTGLPFQGHSGTATLL